MKFKPELIELDYQDLQSKLDQIEAALGPELALPFRQLLEWYTTLLGILRDKSVSIGRLKRMLFGSKTERTCDVLPSDSNAQDADSGGPTADGVAADGVAAGEETGLNPDADSPSSSRDSQGKKSQGRRRPGHGRIPAAAYTGCAKVVVTHESLCPGDPCPGCGEGTVYRQSNWSPVVRLKGQTPVGGTVYQLERLRCHLCGRVHTAQLPPEAGADKYDPSVAGIIATLRYGEGLPWNRVQRIQQAAGVPLPASTQWEVVRDAVERGLQVVYDHLLWLAAQGELVHNDDTAMRVLALQDRLKKQQPLLEEDPERRGIYTTGILSLAQGRPTIALFFTGPYHSGENLRSLLSKRQDQLPPPIQMCDALSRNMPEDLRVILANCLVHGRRNFVDVVEAFPKEVEYVLECLKKVYQTEAQAKKQQLSADDRLRLHHENSGPVMEELQRWLNQQINEKLVEPNSSLGSAIAYMLKHWKQLTLFLRVPGAPLDNNLCEQALKMAIRHRRNSLFYKSTRGAEVGDLYMSLIHTCYFSSADPFDYLVQVQRNRDRVSAAPGDWMPWNYRQQLAGGEPAAASNCGTANDQLEVTTHLPDN